MIKILYGGKLLFEGKIVEGKAVVFSDKVVEVLDEHIAFSKYPEASKTEYKGVLAPGFVDVHIHGSAGSDTMDATPEALQTIADSVAKFGTTSFLATTMTMSKESIDKAFTNVRDYMNNANKSGAEILGVHMEGPFINQQFKGAQDPQFIQRPNIEWVRENLDIIRWVTIAPEVDGAEEFIKDLSKEVVISLGHTAATYECACHAFDNGAKHITHCFNAMTGLHHRNPGVVGAALAKDFSVEFIADGVHFHKDLFQPIIGAKARDKRVLVTDAMRAQTLEEGIYDLGGQPVEVKDGVASLVHGNSIAGSVLTLDKALRNVTENTRFTLEEILEMLSLNPATILGVADRKGSIAQNKDADFVILTDELEISSVYTKGKLHYQK